jgi:high affinity sulfate transporter 1
MALEAASHSTWTRFAPIGGWLRHYQREWAVPDVLAGLTLWAVMVPEAMAYSRIVGVPAIMGLYTLVPPLVAYALFGTSRRLVVGPDTATGVISALTVGAVATRGSAEFSTTTSTLAVLIGFFFLLFGVLRMGWVAAFIAKPVMQGFIEGLVWVTIAGQLGGLLGVHETGDNFFAKLVSVARSAGSISVPAAATGLTSLAAMILLRRFAPRVPAAFVVAAAATLAVRLLGPHARGIDTVGPLPSGLPHLTLPHFDFALLHRLAPGALSIVLVGYAEALGAAKAASDGDDIEPNQELAAHGAANALSGLFGGFLAVGSLSKTSVAIGAGARTQVANLVAAALCFLTLVFLTPLFIDLPHPALAAIVIAAMLHLSKLRYFHRLAAEAPWELALGVAVVAGELVLGVLPGIALGVVVSILLLIYRTSHLRGSVLGKLPNEEAYASVELHPDARTFPGLLILNPGGALFFASFGQFEKELKAALARSQPPAKQVLIDASSVAFIDSSARDGLLQLIEELGRQGIVVAFARVRDPIFDDLRRAGVVDACGARAFHDRVTEGVKAFEGADVV